MKLNNKNILLLGGFFLTVLLSYHLAFKKTFILKKEYKSNLYRQEEATRVPQELTTLSQRERYLDKELQKLNSGTSSIQNNLLTFLNEVSTVQNVKIIDFKSPHVFSDTNSKVKTYILSLEGSFNGMLKLINEIEINGSFGAVSHITFEKKKNHRNRKNYLQATVFIEHTE